MPLYGAGDTATISAGTADLFGAADTQTVDLLGGTRNTSASLAPASLAPDRFA